MPQVRGGGDLAQEAVAAEYRGEVGVQHLDGDVARVAVVAREVDGGHPAFADGADDGVAAREGGGEAREEDAHRAKLPHTVARGEARVFLRSSFAPASFNATSWRLDPLTDTTSFIVDTLRQMLVGVDDPFVTLQLEDTGMVVERVPRRAYA